MFKRWGRMLIFLEKIFFETNGGSQELICLIFHFLLSIQSLLSTAVVLNPVSFRTI